jgi:hypothetical protein
MKMKNISIVVLLFVITLAIFGQLDAVDRNTKLRGELERVQNQLQMTRDDLGVCQGEMR